MNSATQLLSQIWARLQNRERVAVGIALAVVLAGSSWAWLIHPPLRTLSSASAQHALADAELAKVQSLAAAAIAAKASPPISTDDSLRALEALVRTQLGQGSGLTAVGDQATITIKAVPAQQLLTFVQAARTQARALPSQVSLQRSTPTGTTSAVTWDGRMVISLHTTP